MSGGSILNLKFSAGSIRNTEGIQRLAEFLKGAYETGFFHMQFNIADEKVLRDAQIIPEKYPDLLIRVAGYSAFFTQISRCLQDDIIDRTAHMVS
jgi:formate C-acetyltransferase